MDEYRSAYPLSLQFDYTFHANEAPFDIQSIYHDDKFTYIKTNAPEKFSVYEMKDGKPDLVNYDLRDGTYIIPKVMDGGYVRTGQETAGVHAQGMNGDEYAGTNCELFQVSHRVSHCCAARCEIRKAFLQKNLKPDALDLGAALLVIGGSDLQLLRKEDALCKASGGETSAAATDAPGQHRQ